MLSTTELYGVEPSEFIHLTYLDALVFKFHAAKRVVATAMKQPFNTRTEDWHESYDAMKHNRKLIEEAIGVFATIKLIGK